MQVRRAEALALNSACAHGDALGHEWHVYQMDGKKKVPVSPEQATKERDFMVQPTKDKKDHAIHSKARAIWTLAQNHIHGLYESMLAVRLRSTDTGSGCASPRYSDRLKAPAIIAACSARSTSS